MQFLAGIFCVILQVMIETVVDATRNTMLRTALWMMQSMSQVTIGSWCDSSSVCDHIKARDFTAAKSDLIAAGDIAMFDQGTRQRRY